MMLYVFAAFAASCVFTSVFMPRLIKYCAKKKLYDVPNGRKVHRTAVPRLGGLLFVPAMVAGTAAAFLLMSAARAAVPRLHASSFILVSGVLLIYTTGLIDDLVGIRAKRKFLMQALAACLFPVCGLSINNLGGFLGIYALPAAAGWPLTVLVVMTVVNSINLIDGIDGLASGLSILIMAAFAALFAGGAAAEPLVAGALAGSLASFFYFNVFGKTEKGTKTFMGDAGSLTIGYVTAYLALKYSMGCRQACPGALLWPYTLLIVPVADVVRVTVERKARRVPIFKADKSHIHHVIMKAGFTMRQTLVIILSLFAFFCLLNALLYGATASYNIVAAADFAAYAAFFALMRAVRPRPGQGPEPPET